MEKVMAKKIDSWSQYEEVFVFENDSVLVLQLSRT